EGLAQVVFDPDREETFALADRVRSEYVVKVRGKVRPRPAGAVNPNMASGAIEVLGYELEVLNQAETPPFPLDEYSDVGEETRSEGLAQVVFDPDREETFALADRVRSEYVVKVRGKVRPRPAGAVNPNMASGAIEVLGYELEVLNQAETPPFPLDEYSDVGEET